MNKVTIDVVGLLEEIERFCRNTNTDWKDILQFVKDKRLFLEGSRCEVKYK